VKRLVNDRSGGAVASDTVAAANDGVAVVVNGNAAARPCPRSRAAAAALANAAERADMSAQLDDSIPAAPSTPAAAARWGLAEARQLHREGRDEEGVDILVEWLDGPAPSPHDAEMQELQQAMVALGCWLCNTLATRHLHARRVARAFGYTTTCERWLGLRQVAPDDSSSEEMWARLQYDRALNGAELAQSSGDRPKAICLLRECERLQAAVPSLPDPEATHLCLAEVLLQSGRHAEAATAAVCATQLLRKQAVDDEERKIYGLLFAISLEQAALAAMGSGAGSAPPPLRALRCLADAEAAWALVKPSLLPSGSAGATPGIEAARALLLEMRAVHARLLQRATTAHTAAHTMALSQSAPRLTIAETTAEMTAPNLHHLLDGNACVTQRKKSKDKKKSSMGSPSKALLNAASLEQRDMRMKKGMARHKEIQEDVKQLQQQMRSTCSLLGSCGAEVLEEKKPPNAYQKRKAAEAAAAQQNGSRGKHGSTMPAKHIIEHTKPLGTGLKSHAATLPPPTSPAEPTTANTAE